MNTALRTHDVVELWPGGIAPGSEHSPARYTITERSTNAFWPDRAVSGITRPSLTAFVPERPDGSALIVAPGGSYEYIVLDKEAGEMAQWLNPLGVTVLLLQYRLPAEGHQRGADAPLADAQRAIRVVRQHAAAWGLDPGRVGFLGASAGGHVGAMLGTQFARATYAAVDAADAQSARPDCTILLYPVISLADPWAHPQSRRNLLGETPSAQAIERYSAERQVGADASPAFIVAADDDPAVPAHNSVLYHQALLRAGVPSVLHRYAQGGHGFGIRDAGQLPVSIWPRLAADWLRITLARPGGQA